MKTETFDGAGVGTRGAAKVLRIVSLFLLGIVTGRLVDVWFVVTFAQNDLQAEEWVREHNMLDLSHGLNMPVLGGLTILTKSSLFWVERDWRSRRALLTWVALGFGVATMVIVLVWSFPLSMQIKTWAGSPIPVNWSDVRHLFLVTHTLKTICSLLSFAILLLASFTPRNI